MELYQKLTELVVGFPLRLAVVMRAGEEKIMELWREFCAQCLAFVPAGMYGTPLHNQMCRMNRQISVVFALLQGEGDDTEVLIRLRKPEEPYGNQYCLEANVCMPWEVEPALIRRMLIKLGVEPTKIVRLMIPDFSIAEERKCEWMHCIYYVETQGKPALIDGREWCNANRLPKNIVAHHFENALGPALAYRRDPAAFEAAVAAMRKALGR